MDANAGISHFNGDMMRLSGGLNRDGALLRVLSCLMGGNIQVQSTPNQGSCFILELPLKDAQHDKKRTDSNC